MTFKISKQNIVKSVQDIVRDNPIEAILGMIFFVILVTQDMANDYQYYGIWPMFPVLLAITYSLNLMFAGKHRIVYYLSVLTVVPLLIFADELNRFMWSSAYGFTILLSFFLLMACRKTKDNKSFASHCVRLVINMFLAAVVSALFEGAIVMIYFSINYIFDLDLSSRILSYTAYFTSLLFLPLLFCRLQSWRELQWQNMPKILQFVLNFILSPALIIYAVILYLYLIVITVKWELPLGGVAYMVMALVLVGLAGRMLQLLASRRYYSWFYDPLGIIVLPPLVLFWVGILYRVGAYGLTESRIYLLASGVLMTIYALMLCVKKAGNYRLMLFISAFVIALLTYIPGISAHSIAIASQSDRMVQLARELSIWDDSTGKFRNSAEFQSSDSVQIKKAEQLISIYSYLENAQGCEEVRNMYGENELNYSKYSSDHYDSLAETYGLPSDNILIDGSYTKYLLNCEMEYSQADSVIQIVQRDRGVIMQVVLSNHFAKYKDEINSWKDGTAGSTEPFLLRNDSCLVVMPSISRAENGECKFLTYLDIVVFAK